MKRTKQQKKTSILTKKIFKTFGTSTVYKVFIDKVVAVDSLTNLKFITRKPEEIWLFNFCLVAFLSEKKKKWTKLLVVSHATFHRCTKKTNRVYIRIIFQQKNKTKNKTFI